MLVLVLSEAVIVISEALLLLVLCEAVLVIEGIFKNRVNRFDSRARAPSQATEHEHEKEDQIISAQPD